MPLRCIPILLLLLPSSLLAQHAELFKTIPPIDEATPDWAVMLYDSNANIFAVDRSYRRYYRFHPFDKNVHTQNYKHWRRAIDRYKWFDDRGNLKITTANDELAQTQAYRAKIHQLTTSRGGNNGNWSALGPIETYWPESSRQASWQVNVYALDHAQSEPNTLYCGTETGAVYKSLDNGNNWTSIADELDLRGIDALTIDPTDAARVWMASGNNLYLTTDAGLNWNIVYTRQSLSATRILIAANTNKVFLASRRGLLVTEDQGANWNQLYGQICWDVAFKQGDEQTVFLLKNNPQRRITEFYRSVDAGVNFQLQSNGWYDPPSGLPNQSDGGARLATTPADPNRVYAVLLGNELSYEEDVNWIGVYRSDDAGTNWTLPAGEPGSPYDADHLCLSSFHPTFDWGGVYDQGFYNLDLEVSATNPDEIYVGCLNLFRSTDGAASYSPWGGYVGGPGEQHPDIQDIVVEGTEVWVASDGGINLYAADMNSHEGRNRGINGTEYWGFDSGWNTDILAGGRYHNGNSAHVEGYPAGLFLRLGGAEAPTGYVNLGDQKNVYFSDLGNAIQLPQNFSAALSSVQNWSIFPNEAIANENKSEFVTHPLCYNCGYIGLDHKLWYTEDAGSTFSLIDSFGSNPEDLVTAIEVSRANPQVIYLVQLVNNRPILRKTEDAGLSWNDITLPNGNAPGLFMSLAADSEDELYIALSLGGSNPNKVYKTEDGGQNWQNLTSSSLDGDFVEDILVQEGTLGGVYLATDRSVFYKNNSMNDWQLFNTNLPFRTATMHLKPFYKESSVRIGTYNRGIWESPFFETSLPIAQPTVDKLVSNCVGDTFYFDDYSILNHDAAAWQWSFPGASFVSSTSIRNPKVIYPEPGLYDVSLSITQAGQQTGKTVNEMVEVRTAPLTCINLCNKKGLGGTASASSLEAGWLTADNAFDGNLGTRWASEYNDPQWIGIDLGEPKQICGIRLHWEAALGRDFIIESSDDNINWQTIATFEDNEAFVNELNNVDITARHFRMYGTERGSPYGYSLWEFELYGEPQLPPVGVIDRVLSDFIVFPNPASTAVSIAFHSSTASEQSLSIRNVKGLLFKSKQINVHPGRNQIEVNLSEYPSGLYLIEMHGKLTSFVKM